MTFNSLRLGVRCLALLILAACVSSISLNAQSTTQGSIAGSVLDSSEAAVPGAAVHIQNVATGFAEDLVTDSSGFFKAPLLEPGKYTVAVTSPNFAKYRAEDVLVVVGQVTSLEPRLAVASSSAEVVVTEQAPIMNLESPDFTATLNTTAMQNIPINNRRWSSLAMSTPGVVSDSNGFGLVSVRGISTLLNNVEIDGADDNSGFWAEERGRTREAYSTSASAVREFAVNTGVYSAEYGRAAGGVITSVTKSGTNDTPRPGLFLRPREQLERLQRLHDHRFGGKRHRRHRTHQARGPAQDLRLHRRRPTDKGTSYFWIYTYDQHTHVFPFVGMPYSPAKFYTLPLTAPPNGATCYLNGSATPPPAGKAYENGYMASDTSGSKTEDEEACTLAARQGITYAQAAQDWAALINGGTLATGGSDLGLTSDLGQTPRFGFQEINTPKLDWQINPRITLERPLPSPALGFARRRADGCRFAVCQRHHRQRLREARLRHHQAHQPDHARSISNEVLYQYGRELEDENQPTLTPYSKSRPDHIGGNTPEVTIGNSSSGWGFAAGSPYYSYRVAYPYELKWQVGDILYWNKGNHSFKFGVDIVHNYDFQNNLYESNGEYVYTYIGQYMNDLLNFKNGVSSTGGTGCDANFAEFASQYGDGTSAANAAPATGTYPCYDDLLPGIRLSDLFSLHSGFRRVRSGQLENSLHA